MHQHPRSPAPTAPASSARPNSSRSRELDYRPNSPAADVRVHNSRGLGIEAEPDSSGQTIQPTKEAIAKLNQIISVWDQCPACELKAW